MRQFHVLVPLRAVGPVLIEREFGGIVVVLVQPVFDAARLGAGGLDQARQKCLRLLDLTIQGAQMRNDSQLWDPLESTCRHASLSIL